METDIKVAFEKAFEEGARANNMCCPKVHVLDVIDSTNDKLRELARAGAIEGETVIALSQTNGHGRSGRSFYSPAGGNLYISILLRPDNMDRVGCITPAGAVAALRAIREVCDKEVYIKWVNDLYYNNRKICGILAQAFDIGTDSQFVILGIGINVRGNERDVPEEIRDIYGTLYNTDELSEEEGYLKLSALAASLHYNYMNIYSGSDTSYMQEYRESSNVIGKMVSYISGQEEKNIKVVDIDDAGGLVVEDETGIIRTYRDGEIRIRL